MLILLLLGIIIPFGINVHSIQRTYTMLVECVEDYTQVNWPNLKYTCDGGSVFINKITGAGNYLVSFFSNGQVWPEDWWTKEVSGYSSYPSYHAYKKDYAVFLGHGKEGAFILGVKHKAINGVVYSEVWLITAGPKGYSWVYPYDDDQNGIYTRWITLYACNVLNNNNYPQGYTVFDVFHYTFSNQSNSPVYLHGIVGARTKFIDWHKPCVICNEVDVTSKTMEAYANNLISGKSIIDAWFNAVLTQNNERDIFGNIVFQAHPAALYYIIKFEDSEGIVIDSVDYSKEGMLGFSSTIYPAPFQLNPPPGTTTIVYVEVYMQG